MEYSLFHVLHIAPELNVCIFKVLQVLVPRLFLFTAAVSYTPLVIAFRIKFTSMMCTALLLEMLRTGASCEL